MRFLHSETQLRVTLYISLGTERVSQRNKMAASGKPWIETRVENRHVVAQNSTPFPPPTKNKHAWAQIRHVIVP